MLTENIKNTKLCKKKNIYIVNCGKTEKIICMNLRFQGIFTTDDLKLKRKIALIQI